MWLNFTNPNLYLFLIRRHQNSILNRFLLKNSFHYLLSLIFVTFYVIGICLLLLQVSPDVDPVLFILDLYMEYIVMVVPLKLGLQSRALCCTVCALSTAIVLFIKLTHCQTVDYIYNIQYGVFVFQYMTILYALLALHVAVLVTTVTCLYDITIYTQRRVQPDQCYFTVQITGINFECSLQCNSIVIICIALLLHIK